MCAVDIELAEWQRADPSTHPVLSGLEISESGPDRRLVEELGRQGALRVVELASGLRLETSSYVGSVRLGPMRIRIRPKISGEPLLALLRYAYGLRRLKLYEEHSAEVDTLGLQDLIILQMKVEASELIARGVRREYARQNDVLASPSGRIDFPSLATRPSTAAGLPCRFHRRLEDCAHNRALLAGLRFAADRASGRELASGLIRLARLLEDQVSVEAVGPDLFRRLDMQDNRLVAAYRPFLRLFKLLYAGYSATVAEAGREAELPGFMLDMNLFLEDLVGRFLADNAHGYEVQEQWRLRNVFSYQADFNPRARRPPHPRPDFVVKREGRVVALLDTKYRDLWMTELPRDILYQLTIYALAQRYRRVAVVLYPTVHSVAKEARIAVHEPLEGVKQGVVALRPVDLNRLADLILANESPATERERCDFARQLVL